MNITIVHYGNIPVKLYGGTERVIWYLGNKDSNCNFATIKYIDDKKLL